MKAAVGAGKNNTKSKLETLCIVSDEEPEKPVKKRPATQVAGAGQDAKDGAEAGAVTGAGEGSLIYKRNL